MRQSGFVPDEVRYRKTIDRLRGELAAASEERQVRSLCHKINYFVNKLNTMGTNAIDIAVMGVDEEAEVTRTRGAQAGS